MYVLIQNGNRTKNINVRENSDFEMGQKKK